MNDAEAAMTQIKYEYCDNGIHKNIVVMVAGTGVGVALIVDGKHVKGNVTNHIILRNRCKRMGGMFWYCAFYGNGEHPKIAR